MSFQEQFQTLINQVHDLERSLLEEKDKDIIPLSFFSSSIDSLNLLKAGIHKIEQTQLQLMQEHLKKGENAYFIGKIKDPEEEIEEEPEKESVEVIEEEIAVENNKEEREIKEIEEEVKEIRESKTFLSDAITRNKFVDFRKSLSLNERFMFQRDLFQNNPDKMNQALNDLNGFTTLSESLNHLNSNYPIQWESEAGSIFRELLEKRFI